MVVWYLMFHLWGKDIHTHEKIITYTMLVERGQKEPRGRIENILTEEVKDIFIEKH